MNENLKDVSYYWKISNEEPKPDWLEKAIIEKRTGINDEILDIFEATFLIRQRVRPSRLDNFLQTNEIPINFSFRGSFLNTSFYPLEKIGDYLYLWNQQLHYCKAETFQRTIHIID